MPLPPRPWPPAVGSAPTVSPASNVTSAAQLLGSQRSPGMTASNSLLGRHHHVSAVVGLRPQASFAAVRDSMVEMERHLESLESENQRLKVRLIKQVRPLIMQVAFGSNEMLQERTIESWKRQTKAHRIDRMNEAHDQAIRSEKAQSKATIDDIENQLKVEKQRREALMGQLNHMNGRIEEATGDIHTSDIKLETFKKQLAGAENSLRILRHEAEQVADHVRHEHSAYENRKSKVAVETAHFSDEAISQELIRRPASPMPTAIEPAMDHEARAELVDIQKKLSFIFDRVSDQQVDKSQEAENAALRAQVSLLRAAAAQGPQQGPPPAVEGSTGEAPEAAKLPRPRAIHRPQSMPGVSTSSLLDVYTAPPHPSSARPGAAATGSAPASHVSAAPFVSGPSVTSTPPTSHVASPMPHGLLPPPGGSVNGGSATGIGTGGGWIHQAMPQGHHRYSSPGPGGPPMLRPPPPGMMHIPPPPPHAGAPPPHMRALSPLPARVR